MKPSLAAILALSLTACAASYQPVPEGYAGPVASLGDTVVTAGRTRARIFAAAEIDGKTVANSFTASAQASAGAAFALTTRVVERQVPIRPMMVKIRGSDTTAAPIEALALAAAGKLYSVEGVVSFAPLAGHKYFVVGILKASGSTIWIQDAETAQAVTEIVTAREGG
jgi:hypothetical protein